MKTITLDFTGCRYIGEVYKIIKEGFDLPSDYGENLDALWDSLDMYCKFRLHVYIKGIDTLTDEFKEYMQKIFEVFDEVHDENPDITFEVLS